MSEQMPPEFEWIVPGVKCNSDGFSVVVKSTPFYDDSILNWVCDFSVGESGRAEQFPIACEMLDKTEIVTLTLTREQAGALLKGINTGYLEDGLKMAEIKKQIEEKLK